MSDLEQRLAHYKARFPIGRVVNFYPVSGAPDCERTKIRSEPWALDTGTIVIAVNSRAGGVHVDHLEIV